ncbi:MAG: hypothetical protein ACQEVA_01655 [Myxococcota bacterium]
MKSLEDDLQARLDDALRRGSAGALSDVLDALPLDEDDPTRMLDALAAILTSTFLRAYIDGLEASQAQLGDVPVPEVSRQRAAQLAVLYRAFKRADEHERPALLGSLDRCVADLYGLSLQLLIEIERHIEPQAPTSST